MAYALSALPRGAVVFVDSNIFIYGLLRESAQCAHLIERCRNEEIAGVPTLEVVAEVCHRLMLKEAMDSGVISRPTAASLRGKQDAIQGLHKYWDLTARIFRLNLAILVDGVRRHHSAQRIRDKYGLLTNDSLIAAACFEHNIHLLATRDADFDRIPELSGCRPTDVP